MPPELHIGGFRIRTVLVPLRLPLATASGAVTNAPLLLLDVETPEGVTGSAYIFCYTPIALRPLADLLSGLNERLRGLSFAPHDVYDVLQQQFRLLGPQGISGMAIAALDMAAWDAAAKAAALPLYRLLGAGPRAIQAYNSRGLGLSRDPSIAREGAALAEGFRAVKLRLGYPSLTDDIAVTRAVREAIPSDCLLFTDYNQSLPIEEAIHRAHALDELNVAWIEEPLRADDYAGHAQVAAAARTPIQLGENWWGPYDMAKSLAAKASDLVMLDACKIGGVTGWLRGAAQADAHGLPVSSHLYPEISAHLLAATPTAHWLEYVDWADPILTEPVRLVNGFAYPSTAPGIGLQFDEDAIERYAV